MWRPVGYPATADLKFPVLSGESPEDVSGVFKERPEGSGRVSGQSFSEAMTDEERSTKGYEHYKSIREKMTRGAIFKRPNDASFFSDQIPRFNKRFEKTYLSPGQFKWLADIDKAGLMRGRRSK